MMIHSSTGSGKSFAYILPLLNRLALTFTSLCNTHCLKAEPARGKCFQEEEREGFEEERGGAKIAGKRL